MTTEVV